MLQSLLTKIVGSKNQREIKRLMLSVEKINALEPEMSRLSDAELRGRVDKFRQSYQEKLQKMKTDAGIDDARLAQLNLLDLQDKVESERIHKSMAKIRQQILDEILCESFAITREAAKRVLNMRHFDVQLMGGMVLNEGNIAEMATGEGKTLVATLPACLNGITGEGVHIVTVNDYLARRDSEWMGKVYQFLGLSVGLIVHDLDDKERQQAYGCDITYGTNNEFGFDYLRDNMKFTLADYVQRRHYFAIVDEVDSILIDEARTPLIISGPSEGSTDEYTLVDRVIPRLNRDKDYEIDEEKRTVTLTEEGILNAQQILGIHDLYEQQEGQDGMLSAKHLDTIHHLEQALRAHKLFKKDVDYVVKEGEVIIVDEFTGRLMPGRRYSDGLHQALEAKEGVKVAQENQTLATITFQNYFRLYEKLAGMTGSADTEATEFRKIYDLDVIVIPTNKPLRRTNYPDVIYKSEREKFNAAIDEIVELNKIGRPVLVGTIAIEKSEHLHEMLKRRGIPHNVLNAKHHEREAEIVAQAGQMGAVTISTNMAGRGTDIVLGEGVKELGGLHILGTERHESRRIDNQLRGRSGRQGDPGSSRFYLSLEDDLLRIFGGEMITKVMNKLGIDDGQPIEHNMISKAIENAQQKVEAKNYEARKHLLEYDDVMNKQREVIYQQRRQVLEKDDLKSLIDQMIGDCLDDCLSTYTSASRTNRPEDWDLKGLSNALIKQFCLKYDLSNLLDNTTQAKLYDQILEAILANYEKKEKIITSPMMRHLEKIIMLQSIDINWKDHLLEMDHMKEGIGMRGYGQRDPLIEYKKEGFQLFNDLIHRIKEQTIQHLFMVQEYREEEERERRRRVKVQREIDQAARASGEKQMPVQRKQPKVGRNDPCVCGSGKKFKKCCGQ
ncbi:MAG: preprotein translocase subunit SecA [bacterium]